MSQSTLKSALSCGEVAYLLKWYMESHDAGWRPEIYATRSEDRIRQQMEELKERHLKGSE